MSTGLDYWTQWTGDYNAMFDVGWLVTIPAFLTILLGSTLVGTTLLLRRARPTVPWVLLALEVPLAIGILQVTSMGSAALPLMFAFGILGRRIAGAEAPTTAQPVPA